MTSEDFDAWRENPVTQWVMKAAQTAADMQKNAWDEVSWDRGECDPLMLVELRTRADAYRALAESTFGDWLKVLGETEEES